MLIIDPEVNCAHIYTEDYASSIKGDPDEVCKELASRLFAYDRDGVMVQIYEPTIVKSGVGNYYIDLLNSMGVTVKTISPKHIGVFLPKLTWQIPKHII